MDVAGRERALLRPFPGIFLDYTSTPNTLLGSLELLDNLLKFLEKPGLGLFHEEKGTILRLMFSR